MYKLINGKFVKVEDDSDTLPEDKRDGFSSSDNAEAEKPVRSRRKQTEDE